MIAGAMALLATAVGHLMDYQQDALRASVLSVPMQGAFRAIHLLTGWQWIVLASLTLLAVSIEVSARRVLILGCGVAVLVEAALTYVHMGVFLGTELMAAAALLTIAGGVLLSSAATSRETDPRHAEAVAKRS